MEIMRGQLCILVVFGCCWTSVLWIWVLGKDCGGGVKEASEGNKMGGKCLLGCFLPFKKKITNKADDW